MDRRNFLINSLKASGQLTIATTVIYSASLFTSKGKFGSLTAGAKCIRNWTPLGCPPQTMTIAEGDEFVFGAALCGLGDPCPTRSRSNNHDDRCTCSGGALSCVKEWIGSCH